MKKTSAVLVLAASIVIGASAYVHADSRPVANRNARTTNKATKGTTQLKGDQAQIGTTYTLGKTSPINFTLKSVEYRIDQVVIGSELFFPKAGEKLMVLHYTLHNPQKRDYRSNWHSVRLTAVDANDTNWHYGQTIGVEESGKVMSMSLKPAQKTHAYAVIKVPAAGEIPKLIVEGSDKLVLRYDLRGKVKPIPAAFADASDATGATALDQVPIKIGDVCPVGNFDLKIDKVELVNGPIGNFKPRTGQRFAVVTYTVRNKHSVDSNIRWSTFQPKMKDQDGIALDWAQDLLRASSDDTFPPINIEPGQEFSFRHLFRAPANGSLKSLAVGHSSTEGRMFVCDLSAIK